MIRLFMLLVFGAIAGVILVAWPAIWGFFPFQANSWQWLWDYNHAYGSLPPFMLWTVFGGIGAGFISMVAIQLIAARVGSRTVHGDHDADTLHGSAHFATKEEAKNTGLWRHDGVVVGGWSTATGVRPLCDEGPDHVLLVAPPRSGKGVGPILYSLLTWTASVVVHDIRGENYGKSAGWQAKRGARVLKFDPTALTGSARWNPLAEVRLGTDHEIADAQNIAMMIIDPDGKGLVSFWEKTGFAWLSAATLHTLYKVRAEENRIATLADVDMLLSALKLEGGLEALLLRMTTYDHGRQAVNDMVQSGAQNMRNRAAQERSGVQSSSQIDLTLYRDPIIARNIAESDFCLDDLQEADDPVALYLIVPPNDIDRLRPLLRIFWNLLLRRRMQTYDAKGDATYKRQLLLMFDEFTSVKKLDIFEQAMAYMGGYGLKAFLVVQNLMQLDTVYGRENSIVGLCKIKAAYAPADHGTARQFSDLGGVTTIVSQRRNRNRGLFQIFGGNVTDSPEMVKRPLMTPDEIMRLRPAKKSRDGKKIVKPGEMLTFVAGHAPIRGLQPLYFMNRELNARAAIMPPDTSHRVYDEDDGPVTAGASSLVNDEGKGSAPASAEGRPGDRIRAAAQSNL